MSDNDVPKAPDYSPIINAQTNIANTATDRGNEMFQWAKDQFANNSNLSDLVTKGLLKSRDEAQDASTDARDRSDALLDPGEKGLLENLNKYTDPNRKAADMGAAQAQVAQNFDSARDNATRELEGFGINPASTRYGALDLSARTQQAAAAASAGNVASRQDDALADQALDKVVGQGNTDTAAANQNAATANAAGTAAAGVGLANTASGANTMGTDLAWTGQASSALGGASNTTNQQYSNEADQYKNEQSNSSGIGSLIGGIAGLSKNSLGGSALMGIGGMMGLEEGGAIPVMSAQPTSGGAVPASASPSNGAVVDDIDAKVNAGEFMMPRDVSQWYGEKFFQDLIVKARKQKEGAPAKPSVGPPDGSGPAFQSRPQQGALPLR